jgi:hypothetical protein
MAGKPTIAAPHHQFQPLVDGVDDIVQPPPGTVPTEVVGDPRR